MLEGGALNSLEFKHSLAKGKPIRSGAQCKEEGAQNGKTYAKPSEIVRKTVNSKKWSLILCLCFSLSSKPSEVSFGSAAANKSV